MSREVLSLRWLPEQVTHKELCAIVGQLLERQHLQAVRVTPNNGKSIRPETYIELENQE